MDAAASVSVVCSAQRLHGSPHPTGNSHWSSARAAAPIPLGYELKLIDPRLPAQEFLRCNRVAEVDRFAVRREFRGRFPVAAALVRAATNAAVAPRYMHLVTDVFEDDPRTPYAFLPGSRVFVPVATQDFGELNCRSRRITLVLDIRSAYARLKSQGGWLYPLTDERLG